ncbi:hypothetical protein MARPO_0144s0023 [Marchantia polymorpha]|uniref:Cytochrome P450 n=1 Tax=Marchantia polymorpha TaxID=3197 RepID=A0A2R6W631_MARPO|nr:hypothetical protein MARPO_0144s0023 [Marchantia polymorpha]|eukprot:PTQ29306.1 hypothetical protein MARPO_0144s0023 [Marchantia polymorpha]
MVFGVDMGLLHPSLPEVPIAISFDDATSRSSERFVDPLWQLKKALNLGSEAAMKKDLETINDFTLKLVKNRKKELKTNKQGRPDLLSRFVEAIEEESITANPEKDLQDVVINFILAGRDTTGVSLAWFLYEVSCNPQVEEKIVSELLRLERDRQGMTDYTTSSEGEMSDFVRLLDYENVSNMHYLHAALSESMRLHGPIPADVRVAMNDDVLPCGTRVHKGDFLMYSAYAQGRMEQIWGSDVMEFKPERWLKDGVFQPESPYKYPVFHAGPRLCLGKDSAYLQMKITMAALLRFFTFKVVPGHEVRYKVTITLHMLNGLKMIVQRRS